MLTIQEAGQEILGGSPGSLYFFCGTEYGVKEKYIESLKAHCSKYMEVESLRELFKSLEKKSLVHQKNVLYVCRYDLDFVKGLDDKEVKKVLSTKIPGTLVAIYDDESSFNKLNKKLPKNVVRFDKVAPQFVFKYLKQDFPELEDHFIDLAVKYCKDGYAQAKMVCSELYPIRDRLQLYPDEEILETFDLDVESSQDNLKEAIAARSFKGFMRVVETYNDDPSYLINTVCATMVEIDKVMDNPRTESIVSKYVKKWTREDVYNMFDQSYNALLKMRTTGYSSEEDMLVKLASLLKFKSIPSVSSTTVKRGAL